MRSLAAIIVLISSATASAGGLSFVDNTIRLDGIRTSRRSMKISAESVVFVLAPGDVDDKTIRPTGHDEISQIRVTAYVNRTELRIRFATAAETMLGRLKISQEGRAFTIVLAPKSAAIQTQAAPIVAPVAPALAKSPAPKVVVAPVAPLGKPSIAAVLKRTKPAAKTSQAYSTKPPAKISKALAGAGAASASTTSFPPWMMALLIVGGIAGVWFFRRRKRQGPKGLPVIDIVGSRALSTKHRLVVVKVESETLLLGCTDKEVQLLRCIGGGAAVSAENVPATSPAMAIEQAIGVASSEAPSPAAAQTSAPTIDAQTKESFVGRLASKLKEQQEQNDRMQQAREKLQAAADGPVFAAAPAPRTVVQPRTEPAAGASAAESWADEFLRMRRAQRTPQDNGSAARELAL